MVAKEYQQQCRDLPDEFRGDKHPNICTRNFYLSQYDDTVIG